MCTVKHILTAVGINYVCVTTGAYPGILKLIWCNPQVCTFVTLCIIEVYCKCIVRISCRVGDYNIDNLYIIIPRRMLIYYKKNGTLFFYIISILLLIICSPPGYDV